MAQQPAKPPSRRKAVRLPVVKSAAAGAVEDLVAVEEPLEIRLAGETVAVIMRTPGDDHLLALGYLFGEGILSGGQDASAIAHCGRLGDPGYGNVIDVAPASGARIDWARLDTSRRGGVTSSACGVCGRGAVEDLLAGIAPLPAGPAITAASVGRAMERLGQHQPTFDATGGTHAAALWDTEGAAVFESVESWVTLRLVLDQRGVMEGSCEVRDDPAAGASLRFGLTLSQVQRLDVLDVLGEILRTFPVVGDPEAESKLLLGPIDDLDEA